MSERRPFVPIPNRVTDLEGLLLHVFDAARPLVNAALAGTCPVCERAVMESHAANCLLAPLVEAVSMAVLATGENS